MMKSIIGASRTYATDTELAANTQQTTVSTATNDDVANGTTNLGQSVHDANVTYTGDVGAANIALTTTTANAVRDYEIWLNDSQYQLDLVTASNNHAVEETFQQAVMDIMNQTGFSSTSPWHQQAADEATVEFTKLQNTHAAEYQLLADRRVAPKDSFGAAKP